MPRVDRSPRTSSQFVAHGVQYEGIVESRRIFYRTDVHQFGSLLATAPLGADDLADLDLLHTETRAESLRLGAALFAQVALGRAVIELVVSRIAGRAGSLGMADQRNMPVAAQRGPCKCSIVGGIGRASCQHRRNEKRELDCVGHAATAAIALQCSCKLAPFIRAELPSRRAADAASRRGRYAERVGHFALRPRSRTAASA